MPYSSPRIDLVVPVYGGWEIVRRCLEALERQTIDVNIIVVDDCSPDDTADRIEAAFPSVTLLRNPENVGFATTCNRGVRHGTADFVVLVNSDTVAEATMAAQIVDAFDEAPATAGSVSTLLTQPDGRVDSYGITADATAAGFVRFHGAPVRAANATNPPLLGPYGAVAAYRRRALDEVGLLDENIFMYGEELDLAFRLQAGGWTSTAAPEAVGVHLGGASAGEGSPRQRYLAGFGRGYLLRSWGILASRQLVRALVTEAIVCGRRLILHRDVRSLSGRLAGWRAARGVTRPRFPLHATDLTIGFAHSLAMRSGNYWDRPDGEHA